MTPLEIAQEAAKASLMLEKILLPFNNIQTEEQYLHCSAIHTALKDSIEAHNEQDSEVLIRLSRSMFLKLYQFEQDTIAPIEELATFHKGEQRY